MGVFRWRKRTNSPLGRALILLSLLFWEFPVFFFSHCEEFLVFLSIFPSFSSFVGSAWQDNPCFFGSFHCLLLSGTKQGEGDQGKKALEISCFAGSGLSQGPFWKTISTPTKVGKKWVLTNLHQLLHPKTQLLPT